MRTATNASIAVIPARGGSKRIPRKNLRSLGGRPLLAYTVEAALASGLFDRVVVSTDCADIADVALGSGAEVPFLRDASLADDHVPVSAATVDALTRLDASGGLYAYVCQLMPNCPLRTSVDVVGSFGQMVRTEADSQLSVVRYGWQNPWWAMKRDAHCLLEPLFEEALRARSQDLPELFCPSGAVWWAKADVLRRERTYHIPGRQGWEIPWIRGLDIDSEEDWLMAEVLLEMRQRGE